MDLVERARTFAIAAHEAVGQRRKYTFEPYWVHPVEVMEIVKTVPHNQEMLAAALLHDVVEDTGVTSPVLYREFGFDVANLVYWLTDVSKPEDGNREARKLKDRLHIAAAPPSAQTVKLADIISNIQSIVEHDPDFAKVYLLEKKTMIDDSLTLGNQFLKEHALGIINRHLS